MAKHRPLKYKTYTGPKGSPEQWRKAAMLRFGVFSDLDENLKLFNFDSLPTLTELKQRWKKSMLENHPDKGGSTQDAIKLNIAYDQIKKAIKDKTSYTPSFSGTTKTTKTYTSPKEELELAKPISIELDDLHKYEKDNYIVERKWDGHRYHLHLNSTIQLLSQHISTSTGYFHDRSEAIPWLTEKNIPSSLYGTILDLELCHPTIDKASATTSIIGSSPENAILKQEAQGNLKLRCFDIIQYKNQDLRKFPLQLRKTFLKKAIDELAPFFKLYEVEYFPAKNAYSLFKSITDNNGEGIVLKNLNSLYGEDLFKLKKIHTYDVVITGYKKAKPNTILAQNNLIGSIEFGLYFNNKLTPLGFCSGIDLHTREEISKNQSKYLNTTIEIKAQEKSGSGSETTFRHPNFIRFRPDKPAHLCKE